MRIVSLLASGTEIVCALGAGDELVGRSHECDEPEWVGKLPACTKVAFDVNLSSGAIDAEVRRRLKAGLPLYHVDAELIQRLRPDVLITQSHCEVCAVTPGDVSRAECAQASQVLALEGGSMAGIYQGIENIATVLGRPRAARDLIAQMQQRITRISDLLKNREPPSVVVLEWIDPIFALGNWGPELVEAARGRLLIGEAGKHSTAIDWRQVLQADPDFLIVAPCGFNLERTRSESRILPDLPGWNDLRAVRAGRVFLADGNRFFNRSGVGVVETVEILAEILHGLIVKRSWRGWAFLSL